MGKTKTVYIADDGSEFDTESELAFYEKSLELSKDVEAYIEETKPAKPTAGMLRKQIPAFLIWQQSRTEA